MRLNCRVVCGFAVVAMVLASFGQSAEAQSVTLTPTTMAFGNQVLNTTSVKRQATLKNGLSTPLTITSISTSLADYAYSTTCPLSPSTLRAGASCLIQVTFTPTVLGSRPATLTVVDNASNSPQTTNLTGSGVMAVNVTPATISFAKQPVGTTSAPFNVTVANYQTTALTISSIASSSADFPQTSSCPISPATLAAGTSCTVAVSFAPTQIGNRTGTLTVTDDAANSPQTVALSGHGTTATLMSITVTPANATISVGATQQYTATGMYSDGSMQNLTSTVTWSSNAPTVVSIAAGGLASGVAAGTATISATSGSISGSTGVTVAPSTLVSITVSPATATIAVLSPEQYTATGNYSNGTTQNLTSSVTWTSSTTTVATIASGGLATAAQAGTTTISAALGSISGTSALNVGLGTISQLAPTICGNGYANGSVCTQGVVSCPNAADMTFTYGVVAGTGAGTILIYNGAAGEIAGGKGYVTSFVAAGFTGIQVAWTSNWQDTGLTAKNILTASCRISSVGQYLYNTYFTTGGFGVLGGSAGAGAVGYWMGWYGGGNILDNVELASGPVYSDIEQGCEVPEAPSVIIVPTDGTPWSDTPNFRGGPQNGLTTQTGYTCQPTNGSTPLSTDQAWLAMSIVQPGWVNSYPQSSVEGWICNNALNNSEAEAWFFFEGMTSPYALTAISQCPDSETVDGGYTPQGVLGATAITNDMIANTFDRHNRTGGGGSTGLVVEPKK